MRGSGVPHLMTKCTLRKMRTFFTFHAKYITGNFLPECVTCNTYNSNSKKKLLTENDGTIGTDWYFFGPVMQQSVLCAQSLAVCREWQVGFLLKSWMYYSNHIWERIVIYTGKRTLYELLRMTTENIFLPQYIIKFILSINQEAFFNFNLTRIRTYLRSASEFIICIIIISMYYY